MSVTLSSSTHSFNGFSLSAARFFFASFSPSFRSASRFALASAAGQPHTSVAVSCGPTARGANCRRNPSEETALFARGRNGFWRRGERHARVSSFFSFLVEDFLFWFSSASPRWRITSNFDLNFFEFGPGEW